MDQMVNAVQENNGHLNRESQKDHKYKTQMVISAGIYSYQSAFKV
jgi:hypothetical protein